ncbi:MAG: HlyD family efflux transporter periplasmic adaptor subunit [Myxococcota bacterium]
MTARVRKIAGRIASIASLPPGPNQGAESLAEIERLLPASRMIPAASSPHRVARGLLVAVLLLLIFAASAPWQQNISGGGRVIAFAPNERAQPVQATISGQIGRWHIVEGARVQAGDVLVELIDNDPDRLTRLNTQLDAYRERLTAYESQVTAQRERLDALQQAQTAQIEAAEAELRAARESLQAKQELLAAAEAQQETAAMQANRLESLTGSGLASQRELELGRLSAASTTARLSSARADLRAAQSYVQTKAASVTRTQATTNASLRSAEASLHSAQTQVASTRASVAESESKLAQQEAQTITAIRDGMIQRIFAQQGGVQVSKGETLATLVPHTASRAVEVYVDGNDAALINRGRHVRLQFEGFPALQFSGWPSVAIGTFGGTVSFVDPTDDGAGDFRVVVVPDETDEPWPHARFLRQGTRSKGWVLLDEVRVGFEIWRQLNGFPPSFRAAPELDEGSYGGKGSYGGEGSY